MLLRALLTSWVLLAYTPAAYTQTLAQAVRVQIDGAAREVLSGTGAPSLSIAIVRDGQIAYEQAYGEARLEPATPATPAMRYAIGSVSKQFTAAAILLLVEDKKLSLDDRVSKWFPHLTRSADVSVRQLLSMTSGYRDYWPQDYAFPDVLAPITAQALVERWTGALDFEPGTKWQYSNTNYVIAAGIVERVAGMPFMDFLRARIFEPLRMTSVADVDRAALGKSDAGGYLRHALGPLRPAPKEATGWLFGMGQLAMTAHDLALWDIAVINRSLLSASSAKAQQAAVVLASGNPANYGLGMEISGALERRTLSHSGAISGYSSHNRIFPDDRAAIVAFANVYPGTADAAVLLSDWIAKILFAADERESGEAMQAARKIYEGLAQGTIERKRLTRNAAAYFSQEVLSDYAASLPSLSPSTEFKQTRQRFRGGMDIRTYRIQFDAALLELVTMTLPDGRYEQYLISRVE